MALEHDNPDRQAIALAMQRKSGVVVESTPLLSALSCAIVTARPQEITLNFHPGADHVQGNGVVAGGIIATMLDFALAFAGLTTCEEGETGASLALSVQFLKPVHPGPVVAKAWLTSNGFKIAQAQAELRNETGMLLATAQSPLAMKRKPLSRNP
jgi:uncharacterized protein (TIGR00369 family)